MNFKEVLIRLVAYTKPYVYDNNISLLELTRKLYKIVNELCIALQDLNTDYEKFKEDVNTKIESFESDMTSDLQALRDYVDSYFSSLDIKQTIRNVLEEMTQDGTLEELLNDTLLANINTHLTNLDSSISNLTTRVGNLETDNTTNKSNISNLTTRVGELETDNTTNKSNISNLTTRVGELETDNTTNKSNISNLTTRVGELETDNTTNKSDITDLKSITQALSSYLNLNQNESFNQSNAIKFPTNSQSFINVASNEDGSVCKIYGFLNVTTISGDTYAEVQTRLRPSEDITINSIEIIGHQNGNSPWYGNVIIRTTGIVELRAQNLGISNCTVTVVPCLLFLKNFGDVDE